MIPSILVDNDIKQLEHVDVLMDHFADKPDDKCLKYIKSQIDDKKIAFFGVSNITIFQIPDYTQKGFPKISFVQNQFNPFREDVIMRGYCKENKIIYMGYAILGGGDGACGHYYSYGKLQSQLEVLALAYKDASKGAILTTQQLLLAWAYSQIEMLIVRSSDAKRIEQNKEGHIRKNVRDVHSLFGEKAYDNMVTYSRSCVYSEEKMKIIEKKEGLVARAFFYYLGKNERDPFEVTGKFKFFLDFLSNNRNIIERMNDYAHMLEGTYCKSEKIKKPMIEKWPESLLKKLTECETPDYETIHIFSKVMEFLYKVEEEKKDYDISRIKIKNELCGLVFETKEKILQYCLRGFTLPMRHSSMKEVEDKVSCLDKELRQATFY